MAEVDIINNPIFKNKDRFKLLKLCTKLKHVDKYNVYFKATWSLICSEVTKRNLLDFNEQSSYHFQKKDVFVDINPFYIEEIHSPSFNKDIVRLSFNSPSFNRANIPYVEKGGGQWNLLSQKYNLSTKKVAAKSHMDKELYIIVWLGDDYFTDDIIIPNISGSCHGPGDNIVLRVNKNIKNHKSYETILLESISKIRKHTNRKIVIHYQNSLLLSHRTLLQIISKFTNIILSRREFSVNNNTVKDIYAICVLNATRFIVHSIMMGIPVFKLVDDFVCFIDNFVFKDLSLISDGKNHELCEKISEIDYGILYNCLSEQLFEINTELFDIQRFDRTFKHKFIDEVVVGEDFKCKGKELGKNFRANKVLFFGQRVLGTLLYSHLIYPVINDSTRFTLSKKETYMVDRVSETDTLYITVFASTHVNSEYQNARDDRLIFLDRDPYLSKFGDQRFCPNVYTMYRVLLGSYSEKYVMKFATVKNSWRKRMRALNISFEENWCVNTDGYILVALSSMFGIWNGFSRSFDSEDIGWKEEDYCALKTRWVTKACDIICTIRNNSNRHIKIRFHTEIVNPPIHVVEGRKELDTFISNYRNITYDNSSSSIYDISCEMFCAVIQHGTTAVQLTIKGVPVFCFESKSNIEHYFCKTIIRTDPELLKEVNLDPFVDSLKTLKEIKKREDFLDEIDSHVFNIDDIRGGRMLNTIYNVVNNCVDKLYINDPFNGINHISYKIREVARLNKLFDIVTELEPVNNNGVLILSQCNQNTLSRYMLNNDCIKNQRYFIGIDTNPYIQKCIVHDLGKNNAHFILMHGSYNKNFMNNGVRTNTSTFEHHCRMLKITPNEIKFRDGESILYILNNPVGLWDYEEEKSVEWNTESWLKMNLDNISSIRRVASSSTNMSIKTANICVRYHPSTDKNIIENTKDVFLKQGCKIQDFNVPFSEISASTICAVMMYGCSELQLLLQGVPVINIDKLKRSLYFSRLDNLDIMLDPPTFSLSYTYTEYFERIASRIYFLEDIDNNFIRDLHIYCNKV